jgi:hypothetical protein
MGIVSGIQVDPDFLRRPPMGLQEELRGKVLDVVHHRFDFTEQHPAAVRADLDPIGFTHNAGRPTAWNSS